ncbi:D-alanyl-lipoteichoic acid biosynthesis protein DltB [Leuconostoc suionicum]|uniref:D-alanyl-lipoteichoic acid biosynthesis protein DltB n=1 Tax=Leuconostoc suionicum TaxID=1511761 RepID=UPI0024AE5A24|nr:D-alanyl-lipoteichoic acid biosynthesis protein DltB [Leuconostoc suionicum]MDI6498642.1 D-alanyl-lipoteichoic acid biosynthesis protein DltB [Leuconostoc suionicum]MDI6500684.1 D-alanyl-lipoteichoic acid biosynthesis protein DltB [Leuconostoc suionicum]MDI6502820.1 D-alanyl-lipoteichoic acid biosynthesis protein DltB [Leuconostoc suionicum]MDI6614782.1 D-alanyl-lipoteichoic acid biosynthesis protein DltB [Leuconostoc suionicum]MDI6665639.1 D-alanyl-lipoteichoic acid biosynthesis protein Dl
MLNLQPYADPQYFIILLLALVPLAIGLYFGKRLAWYEVLVSLVFIFLMFDGEKYHEGIALIIYMIWQWLLVWAYTLYRKKYNQTWVFYVTTILVILPLVLIKVAPVTNWLQVTTLLGFMGISYLTFRSVGMVMEIRDGSIQEFKPWFFLRFMLFMPTISSGPIDRYRRFVKDVEKAPTRDKYLEMLGKAVKYLFIGFLYKFIVSHALGTVLMPNVEHMAIVSAHAQGGWSWWIIAYMYIYGLNLFFDFAGYSMFAVATGYVMGIEVPMNFNLPFLSRNLKEFWNRWHMTLSFWFRDFVFMRLVFLMMKKKWFKSRITTSNVAYIINMLIMGFWHGLKWYYIAYGLFHGVGLVINDTWLRYKKKHHVPHNKFTNVLAIVITFNVVMISFLLFSGLLDKIWFQR